MCINKLQLFSEINIFGISLPENCCILKFKILDQSLNFVSYCEFFQKVALKEKIS